MNERDNSSQKEENFYSMEADTKAKQENLKNEEIDKRNLEIDKKKEVLLQKWGGNIALMQKEYLECSKIAWCESQVIPEWRLNRFFDQLQDFVQDLGKCDRAPIKKFPNFQTFWTEIKPKSCPHQGLNIIQSIFVLTYIKNI